MGGTADSEGFRPLSHLMDAWTSKLLRVAASLYIIRTFPLLVWSLNIPGALLIFILGFSLGGIWVTTWVAVIVYNAFDKPKDTQERLKSSMAALHEAGRIQAERVAVSEVAQATGADLKGGILSWKRTSEPVAKPTTSGALPSTLSSHSLFGILSSAMLSGVPVPTAPPAATGGIFEGILWICGPDGYEVGSGLILKWPPADEGLEAITTRWHGKVAAGTLTLRRLQLEKDATEGGSPQSTSTRQLFAGAAEDDVAGGSPAPLGAAAPAEGSLSLPAANLAPRFTLEQVSRESSSNSLGSVLVQQETIRIPLRGIQVRPVREGLGLKSVWSKRAPLSLSHPQGHELLEGHSEIFLFAVSGAFKEQWHHALEWGASVPQASPLAALESAYRSYCGDAACLAAEHKDVYRIQGLGSLLSGSRSGRQRLASASSSLASVSTASAAPQPSRERNHGHRAPAPTDGAPGPAQASQSAAGPPPRWWRPRSLARKALTAGVKSSAAAAAGAVRAGGAVVRGATARRRTGDAPLAPVTGEDGERQDGDAVAEGANLLNTMEQQWMMPDRDSPSPAAAGTGEGTQEGSEGGIQEGAAEGAEMRAAEAAIAPVNSELSPSAPGTPKSTPTGLQGVGCTPEGSLVTAGSTDAAEAANVLMEAKQRSDAQNVPQLPDHQKGQGSGRQSTNPSHPAFAGSSVDLSGSQRANLLGPEALSSGLAPSEEAPPIPGRSGPGDGVVGVLAPPVEATGLPGAEQLSALNILVTRIAYDLLRSENIQAQMHSRVSKQIEGIRTPPYLSGMRLVNIDLGKTPPVITGMTAEPATPGCIIPVLGLQVAYRGDFSLTLEMYVDPREAAGWSRINNAIDFVQGSQRSVPRIGNDSLPPSLNDLPIAPVDSQHERLDSSPIRDRGPEAGQQAATPGRKPRGPLMNVRQAAASRARQLVDKMGDFISKVPIRLHVRVSHLRGTLRVWVPPPPTDRLWYAFQDQPVMDIIARPDIAGHQLKYTGLANRVSTWVAGRLRIAIMNTLVFPSCVDLQLPFLIPPDLPPEGEKEPEGNTGQQAGLAGGSSGDISPVGTPVRENPSPQDERSGGDAPASKGKAPGHGPPGHQQETGLDDSSMHAASAPKVGAMLPQRASSSGRLHLGAVVSPPDGDEETPGPTAGAAVERGCVSGGNLVSWEESKGLTATQPEAGSSASRLSHEQTGARQA